MQAFLHGLAALSTFSGCAPQNGVPREFFCAVAARWIRLALCMLAELALKVFFRILVLYYVGAPLEGPMNQRQLDF